MIERDANDNFQFKAREFASAGARQHKAESGVRCEASIRASIVVVLTLSLIVLCGFFTSLSLTVYVWLFEISWLPYCGEVFKMISLLRLP